ncbi:hypothetical protein B0H12DRAFT_1068094 [Mycena haematopus]|nr:hypothetical protein B0H12DRAFT_1068094 [Mycena haematopus]
MVLTQTVLERLLAHKSLNDNLNFAQIVRFFDFTHRTWSEIVPPEKLRPVVLPSHVAQLLAAILNLDMSVVQLMWTAFGDLAEASHNDGPLPSLDDEFRVHAHSSKIGAEVLSPPVSSCLNSKCNSHKLGEERSVEGRLYTLRRGILPIFSKSLYCRSCHTRYYHNYFVSDAGDPNQLAKRQYYSHEVPTFIHFHESSYVEANLCHQFAIQMALAHDTCQGIARVYNQVLGASDLPNSSRLLFELTGELVLDAFLIHAILQEQHSRREVLSLPHHGLQNHRFDEVLAERNSRMAGTGQDMWAHSCNRCVKIYQGDDGHWYRMTASVHDGVSVQHACCSVHDCLESLPTQRAHFCHTHRDLAKICAIKSCSAHAEPGFLTCVDEAHRAVQREADERNTAMFQLRSRLRKGNINQVPRAGDTRPSQSQSPSLSNQSQTPTPTKLKGKLTRSWTHNEQLFRELQEPRHF